MGSFDIWILLLELGARRYTPVTQSNATENNKYYFNQFAVIWSNYLSGNNLPRINLIRACFVCGTRACVEEEETFINCFEQFNTMEQGSTFWSDICSDTGQTVMECLKETTVSCPHLWTDTMLGNLTYQRQLVLQIAPSIEGFAIACERNSVSECEEAYKCFESVFWNQSSPAFSGLAEFYSWFCGSEHGLTHVLDCLLPAQQLCPTTVAYLRNSNIVEFTAGGALTFAQLAEKTIAECEAVGVLVRTCNVETGNCVLHLDRTAARITGCLNDNTSQCYTEPEINFGRNVLQCTYTDVTGLCVQNGCGPPAWDFFIKLFDYLKCGKQVNSGLTCGEETITTQVGQEGYEISISLYFPLTLPGVTVAKDCPTQYKGTVTRVCSADGDWEPVIETCYKDFLSEIETTLEDLKNSDEVNSADFLKVVDDLTNLTDPTRDPIDKPPIEDIRNIVDDVTEVFEKKDTVTQIEAESIFNFVSNTVDESTQDEWEDLIKSGKGGADSIMYDVDRITRKIQAEGCSSQIDTNNLDLTVRMKSGDIRYVPASGNGEIFIPEEALINQGHTDGVCYGGGHFDTLSPILSRRLVVDGDLQQFGEAGVINTDILSLQLREQVEMFEPPIVIQLKPLKKGSYYYPKCVSWDFTAENTNGDGAWTTEGCRFKTLTSDGDFVCECTHLTNFAVLMSTSKTSADHVKALSIISAVGCAVSICGLILTIIFHLLVWRLVRSDRSVILMNLCFALLIALIVFLAGINRVESQVACKAIAAILHFLFLAVFFLMLAQGIEICICVVHVFTTKFRLKLLLPIAWAIPAVIVAISLGVTKTDGYGNKEYCWLSIDSGLIWAFVGPAALVIFINIIVIIVVFKKLVSSRAMKDKSVKEKTKTSLRGVCVLLPLLGCTWAFGILSVNSNTVAFQYIFCVLNSLQGLFIFLFHCVFNNQLREALRKRNARKRSLATLESDLKKRSRSESTGQEVSNATLDKSMEDKKSDSSSKKKHKFNRKWQNLKKHSGMNGLDDWQMEQRRQYQRELRRNISNDLDWTA